MRQKTKTLPHDITSLQKMVVALQGKLSESQKVVSENQETISENKKIISNKQTLINTLYHQLHILRTARFGRKSEKVNNGQLELFDESELPPVEPQEEEDDVETVTITKTKKKAGRNKLPQTLPYVERTYDLPEGEQQCACGCQMTAIGEERSEQLDVIPQMTYRVVHIKKKYACRQCEETIKTAKAPKQVLPKSRATPGLLAFVIDTKFNYHMPLYRQEDMFKRAGLSITRASLCQWVAKSAELLSPLVKLMHDNILNYDIAYADETTLQVLKEPGRVPPSKSFMWLFSGGPPEQYGYVYQYHPSRSEKVAFDFFEGFEGYLHSDCYRAYLNLGKGKRIKNVACMAHARRYFMDIVKATKKKKGLAYWAVNHIGKFYAIEKQLKDNQATPEDIYQTRQESSLPLLSTFKAWLDSHLLQVSPKSPLEKAIKYALSHWEHLIRYTEDGRLAIDNNRSERAIKPFVIGRKNWLFHGNAKGAQAGATLYSLIETCKAHQVDVFSYFKLVLSKIVYCQTVDELEQLLPFNVKKDELEQQRAIPQLIYPEKKGLD